ncbi:MAG TPA: rhodanese-like domain-containing protein [Thermoanaerobaculia bacterium]|nr:rhodanese-like domain-containing protein [Thermoanaerobaculia bacterium]
MNNSPLSRTFAVILTTGLLACGGARDLAPTAAGEQRATTITAPALHARLQSKEKPIIVDVREPSEFQEGHIQGAKLAPLGSVEQGVEGIAKDREIVLVCRSGRRSGKAQELLTARGYTKLQNMEGGMLAWEKNGYPVVKP